MRTFDYYLSIETRCDDEYELGIDSKITTEEIDVVKDTLEKLTKKKIFSQEEIDIFASCISILTYKQINFAYIFDNITSEAKEIFDSFNFCIWK